MLEELNQLALGFKEGLAYLLPKIILSLLVLGLGYLLAYSIRFLVRKMIMALGRPLSRRFNNIELEQPSTFIGTAFFWLILLATFLLITDILGLTVITSGIEGIIRYTPNILAAILILIAANILAKIVAQAMSSVGSRMGLTYGDTLGKIVRMLIMLTAIIIVVDQIGIEVTFLINLINIILAALLFSAALAFGLGAKVSFSNILAAYYVRKLYREGDYVRIGEIEGRITKIDATVVLLDTEEGRLVIPAKKFNEMKSLLIKKRQ